MDTCYSLPHIYYYFLLYSLLLSPFSPYYFLLFLLPPFSLYYLLLPPFTTYFSFISHPITADTKGTSVMHSFCCPE